MSALYLFYVAMTMMSTAWYIHIDETGFLQIYENSVYENSDS